jgi:hypothetical protein
MMPRDRYARSVQSPFKVVKGRLMYFYGGDLPKLAEGTIGDLLVPEFAFVNPHDRLRYEQQGREKLLSEGTKLMVRMRQGKPDKERTGWRSNLNIPSPSEGVFVEVFLKEDLFLLLRGTKPARLDGVECVIPALDTMATSLNHAYRLISEVFEPARKSHSGNVFEEAFVANGARWVELDALRSAIEAKHEHRLYPGGAAQSALFEESE